MILNVSLQISIIKSIMSLLGGMVIVAMDFEGGAPSEINNMVVREEGADTAICKENPLARVYFDGTLRRSN